MTHNQVTEYIAGASHVKTYNHAQKALRSCAQWGGKLEEMLRVHVVNPPKKGDTATIYYHVPRVPASYRPRDYEVIVVVEAKEVWDKKNLVSTDFHRVVRAECMCEAGKSQTCHHVGAVLYMIVEQYNFTKTSFPKLWNRPNKTSGAIKITDPIEEHIFVRDSVLAPSEDSAATPADGGQTNVVNQDQISRPRKRVRQDGPNGKETKPRSQRPLASFSRDDLFPASLNELWCSTQEDSDGN
jgi:hypothetical protein